MTLAELSERAAIDEEFFGRLIADPVGTALNAGCEVSLVQVKAVLGLAGVSDEEFGPALVEKLQR